MERPGAFFNLHGPVKGLDGGIAGQSLAVAADLHHSHVIRLAQHGGCGYDVGVGPVAPHGRHAEHLQSEQL